MCGSTPTPSPSPSTATSSRLPRRSSSPWPSATSCSDEQLRLMRSFAFALLADGRLPTGGHAHSAGVEAAVAEGRVVDEADLEAYARGRLHAAGRTEAALAAAALLRLDDLAAVDAEAEARITTAPL